jgi:hypothetical protein
MKNKSLILLIVGLVSVVAALGVALSGAIPKNPSKQQCTLEAKMCPDGTAVGRTGPNCEFAECPNTPNPTPSPVPNPTPSPTPAPAPTSKSSQFYTPTSFQVNTSVKFTDGLIVTLNRIDDSRCPAGVMCIWQGEIAGMFTMKGGTLGANTEQFQLGTVNNKNIIKGGYTFELTSANEKSMTITVHSNTVMTDSQACYVGGCSGQICSDQKNVNSTCEFKPEYACYQKTYAKCERQLSGQCGWTQTPELKACIQNSSSQTVY